MHIVKRLMVCALATGPMVAQAATTITLVHGSPAKHVITKEFVEPWKQCVSDKAGTEVEFKYFPGGQLAKVPELLPAIQSGVADVVPIPVGYHSDKLPLNGVSMLPGLGASSAAIVNAYAKTMQGDLLKNEFAANKVVPLSVMAFPPYQVVSGAKTITKASDFKGKVLRSAGGAMDMTIGALGATPATMAIADTYMALQRGTADGTISALASVKGYNLQEISKAMSINGAFGTFINVLAVSQSKWDSLSDNLKTVFSQCGQDVQKSAAANMDANVGNLAKEFKAAGLDVFAFSEADLKAMAVNLGSVHDSWVKRLNDRGLQADTVLQQYKANF